MNKTAIIKLDDLPDRKPKHALVGEVDLVVVRFDDEISVFYGRKPLTLARFSNKGKIRQSFD